ncbi:MAG: porin family protein [Paludibacter sp.]|nr:porin family protein [Paludibacter sp.]MDD4198054.1 porin family protein [Paludibacter sp.]MDD4427029.1 porin family protein [Paludibacter sp.]
MKRILFSTAMLFIVAVASAQFNFGIKAGYNSSLSLKNLNSLSEGSYTVDNVKAEMWNNFQAGAFARVFIKKFYIQPELLYSIQKKEFDMMDVIINNSATDVNTYMDVSTVQVPLYLGFKLMDFKMANIRVFAGPKFIMNAGSKLEYKNLESGDPITTDDLAQEFKSSQIDLEAGVGVDVLMFALDAKLNLMQDIEGKINSVNDLSKVTMPTSTFVISLSWKLF